MDFALTLGKKETQSIMKGNGKGLGVCKFASNIMIYNIISLCKWYVVCIAEYCEDTNPTGPNDYQTIKWRIPKIQCHEDKNKQLCTTLKHIFSPQW